MIPSLPKGTVGRTAWRLVFAAFFLYAASGGGRIVASDEVTMYQLSRALLRGGIAVPPGATLQGPDGRQYTKNAAGQAVLALPLTAAGDGLARAAGLPPERRPLAARAVVSFFNAAVTALLLGVFYAAARGLGAGARTALAGTLLLGFTTPLWVYAKSFMAEPLESLGLLLVLAGAARSESRRGAWAAALGVLLAVSAKLSMAPFALFALLPFAGRPARVLPALAAFALALAGHGLYDLARFGTPFETGYGAQATPAAYTTPLLVGLYGLLVSSGKGVLWFAPALWLAPVGLAALWRARRAAPGPRATGLTTVPAGRWAAAVVALQWLSALFLYGRFQHWPGDGSFGPRYLIPVLPGAFLAVTLALEGASRLRRRTALVLGLLGLVVQLGGVAIYFGAQMREAGDYPYTLPLDDPRFMESSHFNPAFSPIAGHWRMLVRNAGEHLRGEWPRLAAAGERDPRLGLSAEDQARLLHALDFWWLYARYAGLPAAPLAAAALALLALGLWALAAARASATEEGRSG